jgi:hypothetical protein
MIKGFNSRQYKLRRDREPYTGATTAYGHDKLSDQVDHYIKLGNTRQKAIKEAEAAKSRETGKASVILSTVTYD